MREKQRMSGWLGAPTDSIFEKPTRLFQVTQEGNFSIVTSDV
jgi:hypothetical protein